MSQEQTTVKKVKHNQCQQDVYTKWQYLNGKAQFYDDEACSKAHQCAKPQYQRKKHSPEEAHTISLLLYEFAIADTKAKCPELLEQDRMAFRIQVDVFYKGMIELMK